MTVDINDVCDELAKVVATVGLPCSAVPLATINAPCAQIARQAYDPRLVMSEIKSVYTFTVGVFLNSVVEENAGRWLNDYSAMTGELSVVKAVQNGDLWKNVTVDYAVVTLVGAPVWVEIAGVTYASVAFTVEVCW